MKISGSFNSNNSKFTLPEEGVYPAVCICVADCGDVYSETYGKTSRKLRIEWEIPELRASTDADSEAYTIWSKPYTASLNDKSALRKDLKAWRGKEFTPAELEEFNMNNILGAPCQLQIIHTENGGKTYANVAAIMALPKGMPRPKAEHTPWAYDIEESPVEDAAKLPEWIGDKIKETETYQKAVKDQLEKRAGATIPVADQDDDGEEPLPF